MENIIWILVWGALAFLLYEYVDVIVANKWILLLVIAGLFGLRFLWKRFLGN